MQFTPEHQPVIFNGAQVLEDTQCNKEVISGIARAKLCEVNNRPHSLRVGVTSNPPQRSNQLAARNAYLRWFTRSLQISANNHRSQQRFAVRNTIISIQLSNLLLLVQTCRFCGTHNPHLEKIGNSP